MKLSGYRSTYYDFSGIASNVSRQTAFAGIALIWVFKDGDANAQTLSLPQELMLPSVFLIATLAFDLLQYTCATAIWGLYCRLKEKEFGPGNDQDLAVPRWFNWPGLLFFWGKVLAVIIAYSLLLQFALSAVTFK